MLPGICIQVLFWAWGAAGKAETPPGWEILSETYGLETTEL